MIHLVARSGRACLNRLESSLKMTTAMQSTSMVRSNHSGNSSRGNDHPQPHRSSHKNATPRRRNSTEDIIGGRSTIGVFTPVTAALWIERLRREEGATLPPAPAAQALPPSASAVAVSYPFTRDVQLRELYRNPWGFVRIGRILEDFDSLAGSIALEHFDGGKNGRGTGGKGKENLAPRRRPPVLVTASVDTIRLLRPLSVDSDAEARGRVVYTGKSSMDIRIELFSESSSDPESSSSPTSSSPSPTSSSSSPALVAHFTFACRDEDNAPLPVPALAPSSEEEKAMFDERAALAEARRRERKKKSNASSSSSSPATSEEDSEVEAAAAALLREAAAASDLPALASGDAIPSKLTSVSNLFTCQPQQRNLAGRVFGGFLMRRAFELAFASAYTHAGSLPRFVELEHVDFLTPVSVGDLLRLRGSVLHVSSSSSAAAAAAVAAKPTSPAPGGSDTDVTVRVRIRADVVKPEEAASETSNKFVFAFKVPKSKSVKRVLPETREEALEAATYEVKERRGG